MNLCSSGHAEIAHEEGIRDCPICEILQEKDEEIKTLTTKISAYEQEIEDLKFERENLIANLREVS